MCRCFSVCACVCVSMCQCFCVSAFVFQLPLYCCTAGSLYYYLAVVVLLYRCMWRLALRGLTLGVTPAEIDLQAASTVLLYRWIFVLLFGCCCSVVSLYRSVNVCV